MLWSGSMGAIKAERQATGAAHLLGLHLDPTNWMLPRWEISLRKRLWWSLVIQDKWRALLYGRPSKWVTHHPLSDHLLTDSLQRSNHRVSLPTIDDGDWGKYASPSDRLSFETFIATCKLTKLIE